MEAAMLHRDVLEAARARYCVHRVIVDADPNAIGWPRPMICLHCGADVNPAGYVADPHSALRRRTERSAAR
jgi:hypothetical protein